MTIYWWGKEESWAFECLCEAREGDAVFIFDYFLLIYDEFLLLLEKPFLLLDFEFDSFMWEADLSWSMPIPSAIGL